MSETALAEWVKDEQADLWSELSTAIRSATNGCWSIQAANVSRRIVESARLVGPTHPNAIAWPLVGGGIYETLLDIGEIQHEPLTPAYFRETEEVMREHGGSHEALRIQFSQTIAAMTDPREVRYIRDGDG